MLCHITCRKPDFWNHAEPGTGCAVLYSELSGMRQAQTTIYGSLFLLNEMGKYPIISVTLTPSMAEVDKLTRREQEVSQSFDITPRYQFLLNGIETALKAPRLTTKPGGNGIRYGKLRWRSALANSHRLLRGETCLVDVVPLPQIELRSYEDYRQTESVREGRKTTRARPSAAVTASSGGR